MQAPFRDITITRAKIYGAILPPLPLPHWPLSIAVKNIMEVMTFDGGGAEEQKGAQ